MSPIPKLGSIWRRLTSTSPISVDLSTSSLAPAGEEVYYASEAGELRQCEVITKLTQLVVDLESIKSGRLIVNEVEHPYVIVVSEDCDLTQDFNARQRSDLVSDKLIPSVLFCEVETAEELRGPPGKRFNKTSWDRVKINKDERYHFLEKVPPEKDALAKGLPELGIDFKRYFTVPTDEVYYRLEGGADRRCRLASPYLEHLSARFCYFQSRVALPTDHRSE